jgi:transcriptional regulator with XRE-family HTH domain
MPRGHVFPDCHSIAHLRGEAGLTQHDIATRSGYGRRTISKIENGSPTTAPTLSAIATVLAQSLGREVTLADLVRSPHAISTQHDSDAGPKEFVVAQQILSLHLPGPAGPGRRRQPAAGEDSLGLDFAADGLVNGSIQRAGRLSQSHAVLIDTATLRFFDAGLSAVDFSYPSFGVSTSARSISHPDAARKSARRPASGQCQCGAGSRVVRVTLSHFFDRPLVVQNEIEYRGAFQKADEQRFYAEAAYPTDNLTMLIHFPSDRRFTALVGRCQRQPLAPLQSVAQQPISLAPGRVAYWRIESPAVGERYELSWT